MQVSRPAAIILVSIISFVYSCNARPTSHETEIKSFQEELNEFYFSSETSPLKPNELAKFKSQGGHAFFPIDSSFKVTATLIAYDSPDTVYMPTSSEKIKTFLKRYLARFNFNGKIYNLALYQNTHLMNDPEHKDYLFLPFKDMTSGMKTYGGGRYIDLKMPQGETIVIDFNKSYHPYCAYTQGYSCPVPPAENYLELPIEAGIKLRAVH